MKKIYSIILALLAIAPRAIGGLALASNETYTQDASTRETLSLDLAADTDRYIAVTPAGAIATTTDVVAGITQQSGVTGDPVLVRPLNATGTHLITLGEATAAVGDPIYIAGTGTGKGVTTPPTSGTIIGYALEVMGVGKPCEFLPAGGVIA